MQRRGRSIAIIRILWTFPRQTGTLVTAILLSIGIFGGISPFGIVIFPIAMALYPVSVIPMYIAVRRNRNKLRTDSKLSKDTIEEEIKEIIEF